MWWWFELRGAFCEVSFPWDPSDFLSVTAVGRGVSAHLMTVAPEGTGRRRSGSSKGDGGPGPSPSVGLFSKEHSSVFLRSF